MCLSIIPPRWHSREDSLCRNLPLACVVVQRYVVKAQRVRQLQQRQHVLHVGPHPLVPPAPQVEDRRSQAAGQLCPRQAGLLLEPPQPLREVVGEVVGASLVMDVLSRHRAGSFKKTADRSIQEAVPRTYLRLPSVFLSMRSFLLPEVLLGSGLNSTVSPAPTARRQVTRPGLG